jgi:hypothetical protein
MTGLSGRLAPASDPLRAATARGAATSTAGRVVGRHRARTRRSRRLVGDEAVPHRGDENGARAGVTAWAVLPEAHGEQATLRSWSGSRWLSHARLRVRTLGVFPKARHDLLGRSE